MAIIAPALLCLSSESPRSLAGVRRRFEQAWLRRRRQCRCLPGRRRATERRALAATARPGAFETARAEARPFRSGRPGAFGTPGAGVRGGCSSAISTLLWPDFLGISQDQLQSELSADGATMATVAQAHGKSRDDLKTFLTDSRSRSNADQAVANEQMTQDQADQMVQNTTSSLDNMIDGNGFRGFGRPPGAGGTPGRKPARQ